jgi:predicted N-formylglutamate amidohydrolase
VQSIAEHSAGVPVPGNEGLTAEEKDIRVGMLFHPYHQAIARVLDSRAHKPCILLSIHSFTPRLGDSVRPWHIGVSYRRDGGLGVRMLKALRQYDRLVIGDNEPYPIEDGSDYTLPLHGEDRELPSVMIEIRQDGLQSGADAAGWAGRLAEVYGKIQDDGRLKVL